MAALASNFDPDGAYRRLLDGELTQIYAENEALREQLAEAEASKARWAAGGLAGEMLEAEGCADEERERLQRANEAWAKPAPPPLRCLQLLNA